MDFCFMNHIVPYTAVTAQLMLKKSRNDDPILGIEKQIIWDQ